MWVGAMLLGGGLLLAAWKYFRVPSELDDAFYVVTSFETECALVVLGLMLMAVSFGMSLKALRRR